MKLFFNNLLQNLLISILGVQTAFGGMLPRYIGNDDPKKLIESVQNNPTHGSLRLQAMFTREAIQIDPKAVRELMPTSVTLDPLFLSRLEGSITDIQRFESSLPVGRAASEFLVEGSGVLIAASAATGGAAIVAGVATVAASKALDLVIDAAVENHRKASNEILGTFLADANQSELDRFKSTNGIDRDTFIRNFVSEKSAALLDADLKDLPAESRQIIERSLFEGLETAVAQNQIDTLKQGVRIENVERTTTTLVNSVKTLSKFAEMTHKRLDEVESAQKVFAEKLEKTSANLEFTQELVFGTLPPAEQLKALKEKEKFLPGMDKDKRESLTLQIEAVVAKQKLTEAVSGTIDDVDTVVGFAARLKLLSPEVVKVATEATRIAKAGFNTVMALSSGNIFGALSSLGGLFGFSDPAEERHKQVMEALGKISETLGKISEQIAKSTEAILKGIELLMKQIDELDKKLDRYYADLKKEHHTTQQYVLTLMRSVDSIINDGSTACSSVMAALDRFERWSKGLPDYESLYKNVLVDVTNSSNAGDLWSGCDKHFASTFGKLNDNEFHESYVLNDAQGAEGVANIDPANRMNLKVQKEGFQAVAAFLNKYVEKKNAGEELDRRLNLLLYPSAHYRDLARKTRPAFLALMPSDEIRAFAQSPQEGAVGPTGLSSELILRMPLHAYRILRDANAITRLHTIYEFRTVGGPPGFVAKLEDLVTQPATVQTGARLLEQSIPHVNSALIQQALMAGDAFLDWIHEGLEAHRADPKDELGLLATQALQANSVLASNFVRYFFARHLRSRQQTYASVSPLFAKVDGCAQLDRFLDVPSSPTGPLFSVVEGKDKTPLCAMTLGDKAVWVPELDVLRSETFLLHPMISALIEARHRVAIEMAEYGVLNGFSKPQKQAAGRFLIRGLLKPGKENVK